MTKSVTLLFILVDEIPFPMHEDSVNSDEKPFLQRVLFVTQKNARKMIPINLRQLNRYIRCKTQDIKIYSDEICNSAFQALENNLGLETIRNILEGDCEIIGIISSPGGHGGTAKDISASIEYLNKMGANSKLFIFDEAASSAFILASSFKEKYCLEETEFMFHKAKIPEELKIKNSDMTAIDLAFEDSDDLELWNEFEKQEMKEYLDKFFESCDTESKSECEELKKICLDNLEDDVYFSGEHLLRLGVINNCSDSPEELAKRVEESLGITLNKESSFYELLKNLILHTNAKLESGIFKFSDGLFPDNNSPYVFKNKNA